MSGQVGDQPAAEAGLDADIEEKQQHVEVEAPIPQISFVLGGASFACRAGFGNGQKDGQHHQTRCSDGYQRNRPAPADPKPDRQGDQQRRQKRADGKRRVDAADSPGMAAADLDDDEINQVVARSPGQAGQKQGQLQDP